MKIVYISDSVKILIFAAAVIITCMLVALGFRAANAAKMISNSAITQMEELDHDLKYSDIKKYDGTEVYGSDVLNFIKKKLGDYTTSEIAPIYVNVITSLSENTYTNSVYIDNLKNFAHDMYIKPTAVFKGNVIKNENNIIMGVTFTQK